jgi:hypothetical protein
MKKVLAGVIRAIVTRLVQPRQIVAPFLLGALAVPVHAQARLTARALADVAVVRVPSDIKGPDNPDPRVAAAGRVSWSFSSTYFWASMGSVTRYRQKMIVAVMAPDATPSEYDEMPDRMDVTYEQRKRVRQGSLGKGTVTVWQCSYPLGVDRVAAYQYLYVDRSQRLQIAWHAVVDEVDLATALAQLPRIAASFRIVRDPLSLFAELRDAPRKDSLVRAGKVVSAREMLRREGYPALAAGKPVLRNGVYVEWMSDPEPRYQLLVPLGRIRAAANNSVVDRPRPLRDNVPMAGTIGWREFSDDAWAFHNNDNDYLPLHGVGAALALAQQDRGFVYFYYVGTVRIEEETDGERLRSLKWFLDGVPDVQRRWRAGTLVGPGKPEDN